MEELSEEFGATLRETREMLDSAAEHFEADVKLVKSVFENYTGILEFLHEYATRHRDSKVVALVDKCLQNSQIERDLATRLEKYGEAFRVTKQFLSAFNVSRDDSKRIESEQESHDKQKDSQ